ncbi:MULTISPECIES: MFS transporter [Amycolatopsis]|uniref:MFS transporter n=1 Tax=Amycolatopsis tucumanensis TaxID=401106 RepID=A0ABP7I5M6_9PSEU|nr:MULTISPECIES: MFS transporter [Amycolatopsis]MCF6426203.1 MFS transporter [Amycolatopsis tucumanensis]
MRVLEDVTTRRWSLATVAATAGLVQLDVIAVQVALPALGQEFRAGFHELQWVIDAYAVALAVFLLLAGSVSDRWGRKRTFTAGLCVFAAASLACGLAGNTELLIAARAVQGVGGATLLAVGPALLSEVFTGRSRPRALAVFGSVAGFAMAFGPVVGGMLVLLGGWRLIFLINVPLCLLIGWALQRHVPVATGRKAVATDWTGGALMIVAITLTVVSAMSIGQQPVSGTLVWVVLAAAVVAMTAFLLTEARRGADALLDLSLFRSITTNGMSLLALLTGATSVPAIFFSMAYLQNRLGLSPATAGLTLLPWTILIWAGNMASARLLRICSPRGILITSMSFVAAGGVLAGLVRPLDSLAMLLPMMVLFGLGMGLWNPVRLMVVLHEAGPGRAGLSSGHNQCLQQLGVVLGLSFTGVFFQTRVGTSLTGAVGPLPPEVLAGVAAGRFAQPAGQSAAQWEVAARGAYQAAFQSTMLLIAAGACVAAVVAASTVRSRHVLSSEDTVS